MIPRFAVPALIFLGLSTCLLSGCWSAYPTYGGYGYPDYPSYGYAPYAWEPGYGAYPPAFEVHHPWEDHYGFGGHHESYFHPPAAPAGNFGRIGGGGGGVRGGGEGHGGRR